MSLPDHISEAGILITALPPSARVCDETPILHSTPLLTPSTFFTTVPFASWRGVRRPWACRKAENQVSNSPQTRTGDVIFEATFVVSRVPRGTHTPYARHPLIAPAILTVRSDWRLREITHIAPACSPSFNAGVRCMPWDTPSCDISHRDTNSAERVTHALPRIPIRSFTPGPHHPSCMVIRLTHYDGLGGWPGIRKGMQIPPLTKPCTP